ncbi:MAG: hypothetical protein AB7Y46_14210 [Armatimonadota bacterium]
MLFSGGVLASASLPSVMSAAVGAVLMFIGSVWAYIEVYQHVVVWLALYLPPETDTEAQLPITLLVLAVLCLAASGITVKCALLAAWPRRLLIATASLGGDGRGRTDGGRRSRIGSGGPVDDAAPGRTARSAPECQWSGSDSPCRETSRSARASNVPTARSDVEVGAMTRRAAQYAVWAAALLVLGAVVAADQGPMSLLDAIQSGRVEAVFYGNGDQSVRGRIRPGPASPEQLYVEPGTQFWSQQPGLQGMTTLGWVPIDLSRRNIAYVEIPTACTNHDRPAPTSAHRMVPVACPDVRMAALSEQIARARPARAVAQLAVWAVANDPTWADVQAHVAARVEAQSPEELAGVVESYRLQAAQLLWQAGIDPSLFRVFRGR